MIVFALKLRIGAASVQTHKAESRYFYDRLNNNKSNAQNKAVT